MTAIIRKSNSVSKEELRARKKEELERKRAERELKKQRREEKKAARAEKLRIAALPSVNIASDAVKRIVSQLDSDGKFSDKKKKMLSSKILQISKLRPRQIQARLKARQFQVDMIEAIFAEVKEAADKLPVKKSKSKK